MMMMMTKAVALDNKLDMSKIVSQFSATKLVTYFITNVTTCVTNLVITTKLIGITTKLVTYDKSGKCDRSSLNIRGTIKVGGLHFKLPLLHLHTKNMYQTRSTYRDNTNNSTSRKHANNPHDK